MFTMKQSLTVIQKRRNEGMERAMLKQKHKPTDCPVQDVKKDEERASCVFKHRQLLNALLRYCPLSHVVR